MDSNLSEICAMLGDRIEQYNSSNRRRKVSREREFMHAKIAKLRLEKEYRDIFGQKCISTSTPVQTPKPSKKQQYPASFSSATKTIQETPKRRVLHVHRKIISNARRLVFDSEEFDDNN